MLLKMAAFAVRFWSTLDAYFIRMEIKLETGISVSLLALHVLYRSEKKSVCISGTTFSFKGRNKVGVYDSASLKPSKAGERVQ